jgi:hypothetical protein
LDSFATSGNPTEVSNFVELSKEMEVFSAEEMKQENLTKVSILKDTEACNLVTKNVQSNDKQSNDSETFENSTEKNSHADKKSSNEKQKGRRTKSKPRKMVFTTSKNFTKYLLVF